MSETSVIQKDDTSKRTSVILIAAIGCLLFGLSLGIRMNYGILLNAYAENAGLPYEGISLVVAVGELVYGISQPLFGMAAARRSNGFVLKAGLLLLAGGFLLSASARSVFLLTITLGILLSAGTGAVCFGIVMGAVSPFVSKSKAAAVSGIINASSGIGSSLMSPLTETLITTLGLTKAMLALSLPAFALFPAVCWLSAAERGQRNITAGKTAEKKPAFGRTLKAAVHDRTYRFLMIGFATCGFHMSLIQNHFYSQIISYGIDGQSAAAAYTAFGAGTMAGALLCGLLCSKLPLKNVLGSLYLLRVLLIAVFFFVLPKNMPSAVIFAVALGLCGDATVTPTSEIISRRFGFVCHQIGAFASTYLAGILLYATGDYFLVWMINLCLCALATFVSYGIRAGKS